MMWLVYAILAAIVWGLDYTLGEGILRQKISPLTLLTLPMIVGAIVCTLIGLNFNLKNDLLLIVSNKTILWQTLAIIVTFNIANLFIFLSIQAKNATIVGIIELCYPIFIVFFTWLFFKENHINISVIIGGLLIASGIVIISVFN